MSTLDKFHGTPEEFEEAVDKQLAIMKDAGFIDLKMKIDDDGRLHFGGTAVSPLDIKEQIVQEALKVVLGEIGNKTDKLTLIPIEQLSTLHQLCEQYQRMQPELIVNKEEEDGRGYKSIPLKWEDTGIRVTKKTGQHPLANSDGYDDFSKISTEGRV